MIDYYPLLDKAVAGLENNTGEARRTLYECARAALIRQLSSKNPPLSEAHLTCERLALEDAIGQVEVDVTRRSRRDPPPRNPFSAVHSAWPPQDLPRRPAPPIQAAAPLPQRGPAARREQSPVPRHERKAPVKPGARRSLWTVLAAVISPRTSATASLPQRAAPPEVRDAQAPRREQLEPAPVPQAAPPRASSGAVAASALPPHARYPVFGDRSHSVAMQPVPPAPFEFKSPTATRIEAPVKPSARSIVWSVILAAMASPAVAVNSVFGKRSQAAVATQPMLPALLDFKSSTPTRIEAPGQPSATRSIVWSVISAAMASTAVAVNRLFGTRNQALATQPMLPVLLEFESPTAALIEAPLKPAARSILWTVVSAVIASMVVAALFPIDMVVTGAGRVVSLQATNVVQPLETAIVRAINVREGQTVRAGEVLARLDSTFSGADASALQAQVKSFQAEVDRLTAEASGSPYQPTSADAATALQLAIYGQRQAQYRSQMESYSQKISGLEAQLTRAEHGVKAFGERAQIATVLESKRRELERLQAGSQFNSLIAQDQRIEMERNLTDATGAAERARRELQQSLAERDVFEQQWKAKISEDLTLRNRSLSDATESLRKATLRRQLVDLRADQDAMVLTVAKVSIGSVMQSGEPLITLVPTDAPLEVETRIAAADAGYVYPGQKVAIKFDTFPFVQYGIAEGTVRFISPDSFSGGQEMQRATVVTQGDSSAVFYKARVAIDELKMHGVPGGFQLKPGMTVTADVKAGKRTLLTYLFARVLPVGLEGMREP